MSRRDRTHHNRGARAGGRASLEQVATRQTIGGSVAYSSPRRSERPQRPRIAAPKKPNLADILGVDVRGEV